MLSIFQQAIKFKYQFLTIFQLFFLICGFYFLQISPPKIDVSKDALNHFLLYSNAKESLRSAKIRGSFLILHFGRHRVVNGPKSSGRNPARTRKLI